MVTVVSVLTAFDCTVPVPLGGNAVHLLKVSSVQ